MTSPSSILPTTSTSAAGASSASSTTATPCSSSQHQPPPPPRRRKTTTARRRFGVLGWTFRVPPRLQDTIVAIMTCLVDYTVYILGPILILFAVVIAAGLTYSFFYAVLPMMRRSYHATDMSPTHIHLMLSLHIGLVLFLLVNAMYNYALCVMTSNRGPNYDRVVRELADATHVVYPETPEQIEQYEKDFRERMLFRMERRQARAAASSNNATTTTAHHQQQQQQQSQKNHSTNVTHRRHTTTTTTSTTTPTSTTNTTTTTSTTTRPRMWMLMGPLEWGFCSYSNQPKPPRAHYDHVTKTLVLNMDHYCPWMFNTIGYFNYRYFCNFLFFVAVSMLYGSLLTFRPFFSMSSGAHYHRSERVALLRQHLYEQHHHFNATSSAGGHILPPLPPIIPLAATATPEPWTATREEHMAIAFSFMLCLSVGIAVLGLAGFHLYLVLTAQTTIEFHGNWANRARAKRQKRSWSNPYDVGYKGNWKQVYGSGNVLWALLVPSSREPEFLPLPIQGELISRRKRRNNGRLRVQSPTPECEEQQQDGSSMIHSRRNEEQQDQVEMV